MVELQITLLYAGLAGLLLIILTFNILQQWVRATRRGEVQSADLRRAENLLGSFVEYVPLALILFFLLEMKGTPAVVLHGLGSALIIGRVLHAFGSNRMAGSGLMRFVGMQLTFLAIMIASIACVYYSVFRLM